MVKDFLSLPGFSGEIRKFAILRDEMKAINALNPQVRSVIDATWSSSRLTGRPFWEAGFVRGSMEDRLFNRLPTDYETNTNWHLYRWAKIGERPTALFAGYSTYYYKDGDQTSGNNAIEVRVDLIDANSKSFVVRYGTYGDPPKLSRVDIASLAESLTRLTGLPVKSIGQD